MAGRSTRSSPTPCSRTARAGCACRPRARSGKCTVARARPRCARCSPIATPRSLPAPPSPSVSWPTPPPWRRSEPPCAPRRAWPSKRRGHSGKSVRPRVTCSSVRSRRPPSPRWCAQRFSWPPPGCVRFPPPWWCSFWPCPRSACAPQQRTPSRVHAPRTACAPSFPSRAILIRRYAAWSHSLSPRPRAAIRSRRPPAKPCAASSLTATCACAPMPCAPSPRTVRTSRARSSVPSPTAIRMSAWRRRSRSASRCAPRARSGIACGSTTPRSWSGASCWPARPARVARSTAPRRGPRTPRGADARPSSRRRAREPR